LSDVQPSIEDFLARLERERLEADRRYNAALTAVDEALRPAPGLPAPPPSYDASRLPDANRGWNILPGAVPAFDGSFKGRLGRFIWRLVGPALESQQRFNSAVVDHLNRNAAAHAARAEALAATVGALEHELRGRVRFESLLVQYLQTITEYVDTKDRSVGGAEIRQRLALTEQRLLALKRDVERAAGPGPEAVPSAQTPAPAADAAAAFTGSLDSLTYVAFEDQFRGDQAEIRRRVEDYVPIFAGAYSSRLVFRFRYRQKK
jgi:hypothetical protein